jgi:His-Xaa-Ser system radical SAM maturase HxsC
MKTLVLSGRAVSVTSGGFIPRFVRLNAPDRRPAMENDAALVSSADDLEGALRLGFKVALSIGPVASQSDAIEIIQLGSDFDYLSDGDVLRFARDTRQVRVMYRRASSHNSFLVTERCNNYCLMCSQPPRDVNDGWILDDIEATIPLISQDAAFFTFTGGEPLTDWWRFTGVLKRMRDALPQTAVHVLSNGRYFADPEVAKAWQDLAHPKLSVGIPIYSAVPHIHDHIVQARQGFDEAILGILRLKDRGQRVEIRLVLHALTAPRLLETCNWFARNMPFVDHIALMGLENTGFAIANDAALWIDPLDYQTQLAEGVKIMSQAGLRVSIYNLPLCIVEPSVRQHAVQSISDWKNAYLPVCETCDAKTQCAGFFSSGRPKFSRGIKPIPMIS